MKTVREVADLAGITVRALHHYDEIGLLRPTQRTDAGYRLYSHEDLQRLQEILGWQQLGFSLREVQTLLDDPSYDRVAALERQRELAESQRDGLETMIAALDEALVAQREGRPQEDKAMFEGFDHSGYAKEAEERWGETAAYVESRRRTSRYADADWARIKAEAEEIAQAFAKVMAEGQKTTSPEVIALAERHRQHLSRWFYECSPDMHRGLGEMYVADERFRENWDKRAPGLAEFVRDAIVANCDAASRR